MPREALQEMNNKRILTRYATFLILVTAANAYAQRVVRYDLYVSDTTVNFTGKTVRAIAANGHIPGPTLNFTEGDTAEIYVHNMMNVPTSIHWHGLILPNTQDGVPYLTTAPILPHTTHLYKFPIVQHGTYWYHSHMGFQEQIGEYGALILHRRHPTDTIPQYDVVLSDWTNESPDQVMRTLKSGNDWYNIKNGSVQSWGGALINGYFGAKFIQEWHRMPAMGVSDVHYNAYLLNGRESRRLPRLRAGDQVRLRIINASSSTYFWLQFAGGKLTVIASDGGDDVPVKVDRMIIGVGETYDVIVTVPRNKSYEFLATAEDRMGSASLWLGSGENVYAPKLGKLNYFKGMQAMNDMMYSSGGMGNMKMSDQEYDVFSPMYPNVDNHPRAKSEHAKGKMDGMSSMNGMSGMSGMSGMNEMSGTSGMSAAAGSDTGGRSMNMDMGDNSPGGIVTLNYGMLKSPVKTTLPDWPTDTLHFDLTGNMRRYQWSINNKTLSQAHRIRMRKRENVVIIIHNSTMMRHPMHLHGTSFRILNGHGDYDPMKNVLDVMPMETDTIEFNEPHTGDWFYHCHILYHMNSGMARVFSAAPAGSPSGAAAPPNAEVDTVKDAYQKFVSMDNSWYFSLNAAAQSNGIFPAIRDISRSYVFQFTGAADYHGDYQGEARFGRLFGNTQFLEAYVGVDFRKLDRLPHIVPGTEEYRINNRTVGVVGVRYLLPLFIQTDLRVDDTGHLRFQLSRSDLALTSRLRLSGMWNTDNEYAIGMSYILTRYFSLSANYDSDYGVGGGIAYTY